MDIELFFPSKETGIEFIINEAKIALDELDEAIEDIKKEKKALYEKRPLINLFDKVDVSTTKNFHEINNIIQSEFNKSVEKFTIIEWYIAFNQLKEKSKRPK